MLSLPPLLSDAVIWKQEQEELEEYLFVHQINHSILLSKQINPDSRVQHQKHIYKLEQEKRG